jgi:lipid-A-disaccharide synthase
VIAMLSCGEASGDLYAGALLTQLRALDPHLDAFGFGGPRMAAARAELVGDFRGFSVTGLVEALSVVPKSWKMLRQLGAAARARRPDVFVAIDFPDFNFRLLPMMRALRVPIVYYVSPQLWAWRASRLETICRYVDQMLVIFPFEAAMYRDAGVAVEFVGHPLLDLTESCEPRAPFLAGHGLDPTRPVLALLPGSRPNEIRQILPTLVDAARLVATEVPGVQLILARAPSLDSALFAALEILRVAGLPIAIVEGRTDEVLAAADAAVVASGTATVQAALHEVPMVMVYRVAPVTYAIARRFVRVSSYSMVNLIAARPIVRELVQHDLTAANVAAEAVSLLTDQARSAAMRRDLAEVKGQLGGAGASARAAQAVLRLAARKSRH